MNFKLSIFLLLLFLMHLSTFGQGNKATILSVSEIDEAMQKEPRMIVMEIFTDWCMYCKMQERQIRKDVELNNLLKKETYYVTLNGASKESFYFNKQIYKPSPYPNGIHGFTLAISQANEPPSYPMWVIFNKKQEILFRHSGLLKPTQLASVLMTLLKIEKR